MNGFKCKPNRQQSIYWDDKTPGLGLRVTASGTKSFIFETSLYNKTIRLTKGNFRTWPVGKAQDEATRLKSQTDQGIDPRELLRKRQNDISAKKFAEETAKFEAEHRAHLTLRSLLNAYV